MKPDKVLCFMFLFDILALTLHKTSYLLRTEELTNRNVLFT